MAGTTLGGKKAHATNTQRYGADFYKKIGSIGGKKGTTGGFAKDIPCTCKVVIGKHFKRECAGKRGGHISRRGASTK